MCDILQQCDSYIHFINLRFLLQTLYYLGQKELYSKMGPKNIAQLMHSWVIEDCQQKDQGQGEYLLQLLIENQPKIETELTNQFV